MTDFDEFSELTALAHDLSQKNAPVHNNVCLLCLATVQAVADHMLACPWRRAKQWSDRHEK